MINIQSIHFKLDDKLQHHIESKIQKIQQIFNKIESADIYLKLDQTVGEVHEKHVEIKLLMPGAKIFSKDASNSFEHAFDLAYEQAKKQLIKRKEFQRL